MSTSPEDLKTNAQITMYDGPPYEFTEPQNRVIADLSNSLRWVSIPALALASITLANLVIGTVLGIRDGLLTNWHYISLLLFVLVSFIIYFSLFRWTMTASAGLQAIVKTKGKDIPYLMASLDNLGNLFGLLATFIKVFLLLALISLVLSLFQLFSGKDVNTLPPVKVPENAKPAPNKANGETKKPEAAKDAPAEKKPEEKKPEEKAKP